MFIHFISYTPSLGWYIFKTHIIKA